jgi:hypothetical protein
MYTAVLTASPQNFDGTSMFFRRKRAISTTV